MKVKSIRIGRRGAWTGIAAAALLAVFASGGARAQSGDRFAGESDTARRLAAERIARLPMLHLRRAQAPTERDFELTALALDMAMDIDPTREAFVRRAIEAWHGAGNKAKELETTRRLLTIAPDDQVAQLRLLSDKVSSHQSVEGRLQAVETILGPAGEGVDGAVRSRLALDAALLAQEIGDDDRFVRLLTRATQLDSTNKDAAVLAATYYTERSRDPLGRVEMLLNVLMSDPVDPSAHLNLARELRSHGAFLAAQRFQNSGSNMYARAGTAPTMDMQLEALVGIWQAAGSDQLLQSLTAVEQQMRQQRSMEIAYAQAQGRDPGAPLEATRLPPEMEALRMAVNLSLGRAGAAEASLRNIVNTAAETMGLIEGPMGQSMTPEQIADVRLRLMSEILWMRLWSGAQTDLAAKDIEGLAESGQLNEMATTRYRGLLAVREGRFDEARTLLESQADRDPRSRLGLGLLAEAEGNTEEAQRHYATLALEQPQTLLGAFSRRRVETMLGTTLAPTDTARRLEAYIANVPVWINDMTTDPRSWMHLAVQPVPERISPLDSLSMEITLRNVGRMPLAVGAGKPLDSRILLAPTLLVDGQYSPPGLQVEVADIDRRLRLMPGESLTARVWASQGWVGQALDGLANRSLTMRWRAVQGFRLDQQGKYLPGVMSLTTEVPVISQSGIGPLGSTLDGMAAAFESAQGSTLLEQLFYVRAGILLAKEDPNSPESQNFINTMDAAVANRCATMTELERALAMLVVGSAFLRTDTTRLDEVAARDESPVVMLAALASRVPDPENPLYDRALSSGDATVARFATLLRDTLREADPATAAGSLQRDLEQPTIQK